MTSPAVVALSCKVDVKENTVLPRIDRGEILFYNQSTRDLTRKKAGDAVTVVTAEAVTIYKGHGGEISVPVTVLGKTEVLMKRRHEGKVTQEFTGTAQAGQKLYYKYDDAEDAKKVVITPDKDVDGAELLGIAVHSITAGRTNSVDVIVNFAA